MDSLTLISILVGVVNTVVTKYGLKGVYKLLDLLSKVFPNIGIVSEKTADILKQVCSWIFAIGVTYVAGIMGLLPTVNTFGFILWGIVVGLISNGIYSISFIKEWLKA